MSFASSLYNMAASAHFIPELSFETNFSFVTQEELSEVTTVKTCNLTF
jgi:hypothetical protein